MDFRQLRYFCALAEELQFARAAARVGIVQSPFSKSIKDFESQIGTVLFTRSTRTVRLTRAGERLLQDSRHILGAVLRTERSLHAFANGQTDRLTFGLIEGLPLC